MAEPKKMTPVYTAPAGLQPDNLQKSRKGKRLRRLFATSVLLLALLLAYLFSPRTVSLRAFDPAAAAQLETQAWRHYYEKNYLRLGANLYMLCREQSGASPARSAQIVWHAARAANAFQRSQSRREAMQTLPDVQKYYAAIARASDESFDIAQAAKFEVEWWQQRREHQPPEVYAQTIADSAVVLYATRNADIEQAALLRAQAMAYRDARRNGQMTSADWQHIEQMLHKAYEHLLRGVTTSWAA